MNKELIEKIMEDIEKYENINGFLMIGGISKILTKHLKDKVIVEKIDENTSDGYHTFKELYEHRIALYIRLVNETLNEGHIRIKSKKHYDGSSYDGWFIVMGYFGEPLKQISYHLPIDKWDLVKCEERETGYERDGHTPNDVIKILLET